MRKIRWIFPSTISLKHVFRTGEEKVCEGFLCSYSIIGIPVARHQEGWYTRDALARRSLDIFYIAVPHHFSGWIVWKVRYTADIQYIANPYENLLTCPSTRGDIRIALIIVYSLEQMGWTRNVSKWSAAWRRSTQAVLIPARSECCTKRTYIIACYSVWLWILRKTAAFFCSGIQKYCRTGVKKDQLGL